MRANIDTVLVGESVVLVPYRPEHVLQYNAWMLDEDLRNLTASDPLTLEEEYSMQEKWQVDEDKLTFIILARDHADEDGLLTFDSQDEPVSPKDTRLSSFPMIGDVNIFLSIKFEEDEISTLESEVEIMIAETSYRRRGLASEALKLMLGYATGSLEPWTSDDSPSPPKFMPQRKIPIAPPLPIPATSLVTRISETNIPSIRLFEKLGFKIKKRVEVFGEVEMRWSPTTNTVDISNI